MRELQNFMAKFDIMTVLGFKRHKVETNQKNDDERNVHACDFFCFVFCHTQYNFTVCVVASIHLPARIQCFKHGTFK